RLGTGASASRSIAIRHHLVPVAFGSGGKAAITLDTHWLALQANRFDIAALGAPALSELFVSALHRLDQASGAGGARPRIGTDHLGCQHAGGHAKDARTWRGHRHYQLARGYQVKRLPWGWVIAFLAVMLWAMIAALWPKAH